jgi:nucleotide-binding universal stress UspA family protein
METINNRTHQTRKRRKEMKILVAMDNSEFAKKALKTAIHMAKLEQGALSVLTVAPVFGDFDELPPSLMDRLKAEANDVAEKTKALLADAGVSADVSVEQGVSPAENVIKFAAEFGIDLIVLGHRGRGDVEKFLMGSVTERVVAHAPCSVLVVK